VGPGGAIMFGTPAGPTGRRRIEEMMRKIAIPMALIVCAVLAGAALAGDAKPAVKADKAEANPVTLEGKVICAKCALHEKGRTECQNVLVVEKGGAESSYYLVKNATYDKFGEVCEASKKVRVTGTVEEKDGQRWLSASDIKSLEAKG
jgi:hypothetical protein